MRKHLQWTGAVALFVVMLLGQIVSSVAIAAPETQGSLLRQMGEEIAAVVEKARPAVVSIQSTTTKKMANPLGGDDQFKDLEDMLPPGFREQLKGMQQNKNIEYQQRGLGSGFIIDKNGTILTNNHVVVDPDSGKPLDNIQVILSDGRKFKGKVLGTDPDTEVGLVKIEATDLPVIELGNSDALKVGNFVLTIGSPQGLQFAQSASLGIVSGLNRSVGITVYDNFIQTDAAINMGNSGGPLLDTEGRAVGISTAIISRSGGSEGMGLAIPINQAKEIAGALRQGGKIERGYLGLGGEDLTPTIGKTLGTGEQTGVIVTELRPGQPAEKAGLRIQDAIVALNGKGIKDYEQFRRAIAQMHPGETASLTVIRDGKEQSIKVTLAQRPTVQEMKKEEEGGQEEPQDESATQKLELGLTVRNLSPQIARQLGYEGKQGVVVTEINPTSEAARRGLRPGMLITAANRKEIKNVNDMKTALDAGKNQENVFLRVQDPKGNSRLLIIPKE